MIENKKYRRIRCSGAPFINTFNMKQLLLDNDLAKAVAKWALLIIIRDRIIDRHVVLILNKSTAHMKQHAITTTLLVTTMSGKFPKYSLASPPISIQETRLRSDKYIDDGIYYL
jgi:hypothetical protein